MADEDGNFLHRWSRLKQEARKRDEAPEPAEPEPAAGAEPCPEEAFDPSTLPPVESLDAGSDYTAFLRKEVPKALRLAALRKAWATDEAIRDFRTPADYDWDFNAPGYGRLLPTDDPGKLVKALFAHLEGGNEAGGSKPPPVAPGPHGSTDRDTAESGELADTPPHPAASLPPSPARGEG